MQNVAVGKLTQPATNNSSQSTKIFLKCFCLQRHDIGCQCSFDVLTFMEINHRANSGNDGSLSPSFHSPLDNLIRNKINLLVNICDRPTLLFVLTSCCKTHFHHETLFCSQFCFCKRTQFSRRDGGWSGRRGSRPAAAGQSQSRPGDPPWSTPPAGGTGTWCWAPWGRGGSAQTQSWRPPWAPCTSSWPGRRYGQCCKSASPHSLSESGPFQFGRYFDHWVLEAWV